MSRIEKRRLVTEFGVIVLGVLTALALEGAWQGWQDLQSESRYLLDIHAEATSNARFLAAYAEETEGILRRFDVALEKIRDDEVTGDESELLQSIRAAARQSGSEVISRAVFEDLQSTGNLRLIRRPELRRDFAAAYARQKSASARMDIQGRRIGSQLLHLVSGYDVGLVPDQGEDAVTLLHRVISDPTFEAEANRERNRLYSVARTMRQGQRAFEELATQLESPDSE